ncbi:MAG TPA: hypothetical protein VJT08_15525 [Terriglobales bacterium]|nr:hypothetical protein [Terriglobales bacterium]
MHAQIVAEFDNSSSLQQNVPMSNRRIGWSKLRIPLSVDMQIIAQRSD